MEHFTNYQQMIAPAMVWESIERNDAVENGPFRSVGKMKNG